MRCLYPRTVGFLSDGKTITWSQKNYSKEYATFQLPCSKCIECRLEYARQWAVRSVHEASMHEQNSFITLTYSDEKLKSPKLQYIEFQLFAKRLRKYIFKEFIKTYGKLSWQQLTKEEKNETFKKHEISIFVTGEYGEGAKDRTGKIIKRYHPDLGEITQRPHWHALIFNWRPHDSVYKYTNDNGDKVFSSYILETLWGNGTAELGQITFKSAGYCARYAAKKLIHGHDSDHDFQPISKKSSKNAIGKKFLEKYWQDIFNHGEVILPDGNKSTIPRYYEKWLLKNHPEHWIGYVTKLKAQRIKKAELKSQLEKQEINEVNDIRLQKHGRGPQIAHNKVREKIINQKFKQLQSYLKGDI